MSPEKISKVYCEARFWRPTGLGNRLFPWARCKVFSQETGVDMLCPVWSHFRGASIIRGGIDYSLALRKILLFDNFKAAEGEITGLKRYLIRRSSVTSTVGTLSEAMQRYQDSKGPEKRLISFAGHLNHEFDDLRPYHDRIWQALIAMTRRKWLENSLSRPYIGINVRMGKDFKEAANEQDFLNNRSDYLRTPIRWYIESLRFIRKTAGFNIPAVLISDGNISDMKELMQEPDIIFATSKSAIGDLLILSNSCLFIGSGRSSFSAWISFLGQMPTITIPGSSLQSFNVSENMIRHYVGELDFNAPDDLFIQAVRKKAGLAAENPFITI